MSRSLMTRILLIVLAIALLGSLPVLAGCSPSDFGVKPVNSDEDGNNSAEETGPVAEEEAPPATSGEPGAPTDASPTDDGSTADQKKPPATLSVRLVWVSAGENGFATERTIPYTQAVGTATMKELLAGLTPEEQATWPALSTAIPAGTKLLGLSVSNGVAKVNLSKEFESGGGTFSVTARIAQVVFTLTQFPTVEAVEFYVEGVKVDVFSSEGLILDGPQTPADYEDLLPMDA